MNRTLNILSRMPAQLTDRFVDCIRESGDMMIQLALHFEKQLDADRLAKALDLALDTIPILGCRLERRWWRPNWERLSEKSKRSFYFVETAEDYDSFKSQSIDTYMGPQANVCLWKSPDGARVILKVSHQAADAAGLKETARIISSIYSRLKGNPNYCPEHDISGSRSIRQILEAVPMRYYPRLLSQFLRDNRASQSKEEVLTVLTSGDRANPPKFVEHFIPKGHTDVISEYAHSHGVTVNDMLLAAFFRALASTQNWDGTKLLKATTTVDLRQYMADRKFSAVSNLSIPIWGWPDLRTDIGNDFPSTLNRVSNITQGRKQRYLGIETLLGMLIVLSPIPHDLLSKLISRGIRDKMSRGNFASAYTNMGIINPETVIFDDKPVKAYLLPPPVYPPWFMLGISRYEDVISLSAGIYSDQREHVEQFLKAMINELPR